MLLFDNLQQNRGHFGFPGFRRRILLTRPDSRLTLYMILSVYSAWQYKTQKDSQNPVAAFLCFIALCFGGFISSPISGRSLPERPSRRRFRAGLH
mgnify:FL=1